ncbi:MAG: peptidylprolyl isomerase [Deltaproteobacteria bacterium]|nr:peptidylprolyl isomerase [Deltaproteobacteria bacterium]
MNVLLHKIFRSAAVGTALLLICGAAFAADNPAPAADGTSVARVNGVLISRDAFEEALSDGLTKLASASQYPTDEQMIRIEKGILEKLIHEELLYQESRRRFPVDKAEVDREIDAVRKMLASDDDYRLFLRRMSKTEEAFSAGIARKLALRKIVNGLFWDVIAVADEELARHYEEHRETFIEQEKLKVRQITVYYRDFGSEPAKQEALRRLEEARKRCAAGEDFATVAKEFSNDLRSGGNNGEIVYIRRGQSEPAIEEAAFALNPGDVSDSIETNRAVHIIKLEERVPGKSRTLEEVKSETTPIVKREKVNRALNDFIMKLKADAAIERYL